MSAPGAAPKVKVYADLAVQAGPRRSPLLQMLLEGESFAHRDYELVRDPAESRLWILPGWWNDYAQAGRTALAVEYARRAEAQGALVLVWGLGDEENIIPFANAVQIESGLHRSLPRAPRHAIEAPVEVDDYVAFYYRGEWRPLPRTIRPRVGFCGQAGYAPHTRARAGLRNARHLRRWRAGRAATVPVLYDYTASRRRILEVVARTPGINADFVVRRRYRAGLRGMTRAEKMAHPTQVQFVDNIYGTHFTLCVRGAGNFTQRFYETLCLGRIPVLLDTDSVLPLDGAVDWDSVILRVPAAEIERTGEIIEAFYARTSAAELEARQRRCREMWLTRVRPEGFYPALARRLAALEAGGPPA